MAFAPGKSGNPGGRPKERPSKSVLGILLKEAEDTGTAKSLRAIWSKFLGMAAEGNLEAWRLCLERYEGKMPNPIVGDDDEDPVTVRTIVTGVPRAGE